MSRASFSGSGGRRRGGGGAAAKLAQASQGRAGLAGWLAGWQAMQAIGREKGNIFPSQPTLPNDQITSELGVIYVPIPERAAASMATHDKRKSLTVAAARRGLAAEAAALCGTPGGKLGAAGGAAPEM